MSKEKTLGHNFEVRVVKKAQDLGLVAGVQPGSGVFKDFPHDVVVEGMLGECKVRSTPPSLAQMEKWLEGVQFLCYNHKGSREPLVLMRLETFLAALAATDLKRSLTQNGSK